MIGLVGVAGLGGAGKTTAVEHLARITAGEIVYLGAAVLNEIEARGLARTPENEKHVRLQMRQQRGAAAFAKAYETKVSTFLANGVPVFIDAIFVQAEFDLFRSCAGSNPVHLIAIEAQFDLRYARVEGRAGRTFSRQELADRDKIELDTLRTGAVMAAATYTIRNEGSLEDFYNRLGEFLLSCSAPRGASA